MSSETTTIKIHEGNSRLVMAHFIRGHRTISNQYLSFERSLYIRAYIAELPYSIITPSLQSLITCKVIFLVAKIFVLRQGRIKDMSKNFNDTATTEIYTGEDTLSLHDALPI